MPSATIKIFLIYGDPKRLRTAELSNWNGKAVAGPRNEFDEILKREESANPGVYFLSGIDLESDKIKKIKSSQAPVPQGSQSMEGISMVFLPGEIRMAGV